MRRCSGIGSSCNILLLLLWLHRGNSAKKKISCGILATSCCFCGLVQIWLSLEVSSGWRHCYWFLAGVCQLDRTAALDFYLIFWTGLLLSWQENWAWPQRTTSKPFHHSHVLLTLLFLLALWGKSCGKHWAT